MYLVVLLAVLGQSAMQPAPVSIEQSRAKARIEALGGSVMPHFGADGRIVDLITFRGQKFTDGELELLWPFRDPPPLGLGFIGTGLTDDGISRALSNFKRIRDLAIAEMPIADAALRPVGGLEQIETLSLGRTRITSETLKLIANQRRLRYLDVADTLIDDSGIKYLEKLTELRTLFLSGTQVTSAGLRSVGALQNLLTVTLNNTSIDDTGLMHLARLQQLKVLRLDRTRVTNEGMAAVAMLRGLADLNLEHTAVNETGIAQLQFMQNLQEVRWIDPDKATLEQKRFQVLFIFSLSANETRWKDAREKLKRGELTVDQLITPP